MSKGGLYNSISRYWYTKGSQIFLKYAVICATLSSILSLKSISRRRRRCPRWCKQICIISSQAIGWRAGWEGYRYFWSPRLQRGFQKDLHGFRLAILRRSQNLGKNNKPKMLRGARKTFRAHDDMLVISPISSSTACWCWEKKQIHLN